VATWGMLEWWKPFAIILMLPASLLVVIGLTTPNPTALAQEGRLAQPPQGIVRVTRHPFLIGVGLWALVHLIGNGDVASLVFFATWAIVALAGTVSIDRKRQRLLGAAWEPFAAQTSIVPFAAIAAGRNRFEAGEIGLWRWGAALAAYALMLGGHAPIIGVSPFPRDDRPDICTKRGWCMKRRWRPQSVAEPAMIMKCSQINHKCAIDDVSKVAPTRPRPTERKRSSNSPSAGDTVL